MKAINVLSLFDGISVAQLALHQLNIPIQSYYASEIDKNAMRVTQHHFPDTIQLGDVKQVDGKALPPIDEAGSGTKSRQIADAELKRDIGIAFAEYKAMAARSKAIQRIKNQAYEKEAKNYGLKHRR